MNGPLPMINTERPYLMYRRLRFEACGRLLRLLPHLRGQTPLHVDHRQPLSSAITSIEPDNYEGLPSPDKRLYALIFGICYSAVEAMSLIYQPGKEKMIRDGVAERIISTAPARPDGGPPSILRQAAGEESWDFLVKKLAEELSELKISDFNDVEEYADVLSVLSEMARRKGISPQQLQTAVNHKLAKNGGLTKNWILRMK